MTFKEKMKEFRNLTAADGFTLRQVDMERDFQAYLSIYRDVDLFKYYIGGVSKPNIPEDTVRVIMNNQLKSFKAMRMYIWTIADENDLAIGQILLSDFEANNKMANIGYFLARDKWGQGIMAKCVGAVVRFGFDYLELERIYSTVHIDNIASWKTLEKSGFTREGILRRGFNLPTGLCDCYMYSRLSTDIIS